MKPKKIIALVALLLAGSAQSAEVGKETSVNLYCKSMTFGFIDTYRYLGAKSSPAKINETEAAMEKTCSDGPAPAPVAVATMTSKQIALVSCLGFATGAQLAHQVGLPAESYALLSKRRDFAANACGLNPKKFQSDILKFGPDYVLTQNY